LRNFGFLMCFLAVYLSSTAQQSRQYVFTHLNNSSGLASNVVTAVVQDNDGYIWIGSINGLQRYDGNKFVTFRNNRKQPASLPNDNIKQLFIDKKGRLWVICAGNKVGIFNTKTFDFKEVPVRLPGEIYRVHTHFLEDQQGRMSIVFGKTAMVTYNETKGEFAERYNLMHWPEAWTPKKIFLDTIRQQYWMSSDSGLIVFNTHTKNFNYRGHNPDKNLAIEKFGRYTFALNASLEKNGRFWFYRWVPLQPRPELYSLDMNTGVVSSYDEHIFEVVKDYHEINGITIQQNRKLWFWGQPFIAEYNEASNKLQVLTNKIESEYSLHFDVTNYLYEDREQNLWVCTNNGLFIFNPSGQLFNNITNIRPSSTESSSRFVSTILQNDKDEIWVSTWGDGIYSYTNNFKPLVNPVSSQPKYSHLYVFNMLRRSNGDVWISCQFGDLMVYHPNDKTIESFTTPLIEKKTVRQMVEDQQGNIWMATQNGHLVKWNPSLPGTMDKKCAIVKNFQARILKLYIDRQGFLWVGTEVYGAFKVNPKTGNIVAHYDHRSQRADNLMTDAATDFVQYNDSIMIIASGALNILNLKTNRITYFGTEEGLPSSTVINMVIDKTGFLWLGLYNGLCRLNFKNRILTNYSARNGIINDNIQVGAASLLDDGRIAMGTNHDFLVFRPDEIAKSETTPDIVITSFKLVNKNLSVDSLARVGKVNLTYDENPISIEFSALNYRQQSQLVYYHQLEGIDKGWVRSETNHMATYAYLPPGSYTFRVKCENGNGLSSQHITSVEILVHPPFWKTWWFYAAIFLLLVGILYLIDRERIKRLLQLQEVRTQIAGNLHKDINTTLNNINLLSEIAKIKVDKDITKSKEYIDQINSKSRKMIDDMDDMLWSIDPNNDTMEKTLERMTEFAEGLKNTHSCIIEVIVDEKVKSVKLNMKTRHEMFLIFKQALSNIAEHSSCTNSIINIDLVKNKLVIRVWDKRANYDTKSFQHHVQMEEMQKRATEINAKLEMDMDSKGISVMLSVPLN
jgi:ligand-binding sensor domain-containing protein/signal transduction histidine kinase